MIISVGTDRKIGNKLSLTKIYILSIHDPMLMKPSLKKWRDAKSANETTNSQSKMSMMLLGAFTGSNPIIVFRTMFGQDFVLNLVIGKSRVVTLKTFQLLNAIVCSLRGSSYTC